MSSSVWYYTFLAWLSYGSLFAVLGMMIARVVWSEDQQRVREIERENDRLRQERYDLQRKLRTGREL